MVILKQVEKAMKKGVYRPVEQEIKLHNFRVKSIKKLKGKVSWADQVFDKPLPKYKKRVTWADERNVAILPRHKKPSILWRQPAY